MLRCFEHILKLKGNACSSGYAEENRLHKSQRDLYKRAVMESNWKIVSDSLHTVAIFSLLLSLLFSVFLEGAAQNVSQHTHCVN